MIKPTTATPENIQNNLLLLDGGLFEYLPIDEKFETVWWIYNDLQNLLEYNFVGCGVVSIEHPYSKGNLYLRTIHRLGEWSQFRKDGINENIILSIHKQYAKRCIFDLSHRNNIVESEIYFHILLSFNGRLFDVRHNKSYIDFNWDVEKFKRDLNDFLLSFIL